MDEDFNLNDFKKCTICEKEDNTSGVLIYTFEIIGGIIMVHLCSAECYKRFIKILRENLKWE